MDELPISLKIRLIVLSICIFCITFNLSAQDAYVKNENVDIKHYQFALMLNDQNNSIEGTTEISVDLENGASSFSLDLVGKIDKYGMEVSSITEADNQVNYEHLNNKIKIHLDPSDASSKNYIIKYSGIPKEGLVIDTTKFGQRSFFGDNWPNLARHWLPCVDHPYDKASVEFNITAPDHYDVVATGKKVEESSLGNGYKLTSYKEPAPVATKVVTIGVTKFASILLDTVQNVSISAWVYPENRLDGFSDYTPAVNVMEYFIENIGPYPYAKLANMQAKTKWGGLENAGNISYFENSVTGNNEVEGLIAHEIAHQWFGNSVTENTWNHVWLSEGFATYFTILYQENKYGDEKRRNELEIDRKQIIAYYEKNPSPIVDLSISDPKKVLSTNTYQKAGWVLNMLRHRIGDELFWKGIKEYYSTFRDSNALTKDFMNIMEEVADEDLDSFFNQWIFTKGFPELDWNWSYENKKLNITFEQIQDHHVFEFPIDIGLMVNGELEIITTSIHSKKVTLEMFLEDKPDKIILDPDSWLLFEDINE